MNFGILRYAFKLIRLMVIERQQKGLVGARPSMRHLPCVLFAGCANWLCFLAELIECVSWLCFFDALNESVLRRPDSVDSRCLTNVTDGAKLAQEPSRYQIFISADLNFASRVEEQSCQ